MSKSIPYDRSSSKLYTLRKKTEEAIKNELAVTVSRYCREKMEHSACYRRIHENNLTLVTSSVSNGGNDAKNTDITVAALRNKADAHERKMGVLSIEIRKKQTQLTEANRRLRATNTLMERPPYEERQNA